MATSAVSRTAPELPIGVILAYANLRELQAVNMYWRPSG